MRKMLLSLCLLPSFVLVYSCVTPMPQSEIEMLTTCKNVDLKAIRKNLLLNGYGITAASDEDLITDYKQTNYGTWQRITVVKVDDKTTKFRIRNRHQYESTKPSGYSETRVNTGSGQTTSIRQQTHEVQQEIGESDEVYYTEYYSRYQQTKDEVCGR